MPIHLRGLLLVTLALLSQSTVAAEPAPRPAAALLGVLQTEGLSGTEPLLADALADGATAPVQAALVEKPVGVMRLVLVRRSESGLFDVIARSAPIGGLRGANFGFGIESFRFTAPDRLELALSARAACARAVYTHRFALRQGQWWLTGLDISALRCTERGVEPDWTESVNYLSGVSRRTTFTRAGAPRVMTAHGARQQFPLAAFPPAEAAGVYREMQPSGWNAEAGRVQLGRTSEGTSRYLRAVASWGASARARLSVAPLCLGGSQQRQC